ncbi:MAG: PhaE [uncultured bacterium]|nr:MAG: PhaE [uncultured bacterium]
MTDTTHQGNEIGKLVETWMAMGQNFWRGIGASANGEEGLGSSGLNFDFAANGDQADDNKYKTYKTWEASVNNSISFLKLMSAPENQDTLYRSIAAYTEAMTQAAGDSLENFTEFQSQVVKSLAKVGEHTKAYNFDDLDHTAFESFRELYRTELQKYLKIPKIGLPREFHERLSELADKSNIFSSHLIELIYQFSTPFEKTNRAMQAKIKGMLEGGEVVEDTKQVYNDWIKALEGHFMELLKSGEYTDVLNNTITSLAAYKGVKNDVADVFLKEMQIPTGREMDEVYKDIYHMKKKIRELTKQVEKLQSELNA